MKYLLAALVMIASAIADVSHLSNEYLPPVGHNHHLHQEHIADYAEQSNEVPNTYTPQHLLEPSNSLEPEASQPELQVADNGIFSQQQDEQEAAVPIDLRLASEQQEVAYPQLLNEEEQSNEQQPAEVGEVGEAGQATQQEDVALQYAVAEEPQPAAQEFIPQTYGPSIIYSKVSEEGPFAFADQYVEQPQQYEGAASSSSSSSSGIDTQYGSNGGYVY